ncbi:MULTISPECIES: hypothetical protein [Enterobacteriaceae]|uniref:Uncharacterized protein n=1 Tax=Citrobacter freundii TaxID=546 RepID=A0AA44SHJ5_CITFR|nr:MULTISPECIES: hypothetical protein [Citrobacter freundii complex]ELW8194780.1 hypothetical protein [Yersinia enterocolitica]HDT2136573.1 hypothetical protein [Enterobacter roggenkampii]MDW2761418.1 hypothetical protein [Citrobacter freundii]MEB0362943.1 hypothetical protein [Citrobacter freundii]OYQ90972.1 hypothetical protein B9P90_29035 [Citrobacter freundii]
MTVKKIRDTLRSGKDAALDTWDQVTSDQTSRTGHSAKRVASQLANNVDPEVVALQITKNSLKNNPDDPQTFTGEEVVTVAKFYAANRSRPVLTRKQSNALIAAQKEADAGSSPSVTDDVPEPQQH